MPSMIVTRTVYEALDPDRPVMFTPRVYRARLTTIDEPHCQSCGSTDYSDIHNGDQGYTDCCNERVVRNFPGQACEPDNCFHDDTDASGRVIEL